MNYIKELLNNVSGRVKNIKKHQGVSGELFNIFSITKIERLEVNTHSAMIAELLNPSGSHGQGDKFLTLFLRILMPEQSFQGAQNAKVFKEKSFNEGRDRVDILIELKNHVFLIENKIDALDGKKQLRRYADILDIFFARKEGHLIYLTTEGFTAEEYSHCGVEYQCISYREDIIDWLNLCIEAVNTSPVIKYALLQYHYLIQKITGTTMKHELEKELVELLIAGNNLEYAQKISNAILPAKGEVLFRFFQNLEQSICKSNSVKVIKGSFKELEYNLDNCINWFKEGQRKSHSVGVFFDIGIPNILFRVEVATAALHYGIVPVRENDEGKYEFSELQIEIPQYFDFEYRNWKRLKWFSKIYIDSVSSDLSSIKDTNKFMEVVLEAIKELKHKVSTR
jgi:hypothetical protein